MIPLYSVGMPALSRLSSYEERYRRAFGEMLEKLAMITLPAAATIVVTADWTTDVLFGPRWSEAAPLVACFAMMAAYQPSLDATGLLYMTQRRSAELLCASLIDAALSIVAAVMFCALPRSRQALIGFKRAGKLLWGST